MPRSTGDDEDRLLTHEVELKFDVEPGGASAIRRAAILRQAAAAEGDHDTLYFDTVDGAVRKAGFSLRVRKSGDRFVQAIKRKRASAAGLFVRQEWESDVDRFEVDPDAFERTPLKRSLAKAKAQDLTPQIRTRFHRTSWTVDVDGSRVEVALDEGIIAGGGREAPLCELELELVAGKATALFRLGELIGAAAPLRLGVLSKAERGHALAEGRLGLPAKGEPARIRPPVSEAQAFHVIAHACLRHFRLNEWVLLERDDAEALHQVRVALRRLRSALSLFRPTVRGSDYQGLRDELRWFAAQFGEARNLDALIARLAGVGEPGNDLREPLRTERAKAYARLQRTLRSKRTRELMLRLALWIETGAWRFRGRGAQDVKALATQQLEKGWRRICRRGGDLARLDAEARHRLRIDVKKLRYAAEFLAPLHARKPISSRRDRFIAALKALQERLGELNDAWTAQQLTERVSPRLRPALAAIHGGPAQKKQIQAAEKAFRRASASARYWHET
jgi:triphosphatase